MKISPTEIFQQLCFQLEILYRLSYQWILGFICSFSGFWGLSVKKSPTERLWKRSNVIREYGNISLSLIFIVITILLVKNVLSPAVSKCEKIDICHFVYILKLSSRKIGYVFEILRFEGFCGHPIRKFLEVFTVRFFVLSINWRICRAKQWSYQDIAEKRETSK